jgi:hypothetical protein
LVQDHAEFPRGVQQGTAGSRAGQQPFMEGQVKHIVFAAALILAFAAGPALAQTPPPPANAGAIKLTSGLDFPSLYYFRGIRQESDEKLTMWPYGDVGITLASKDTGLKSVAVNFGVWNSLHTGSSGSDGASGAMHYEEDFYSTLTLGFSKGSFATKWIAYTSPNLSYKTVQEIDFTFAGTQKFAPYGTVAFELSDASADGGSGKGTYLELGATPSFPLGKSAVTLGIPVSLGMSLHDYYEGENGDEPFGFIDIGALVTVPLSKVQSKFGSWNVHVRGDYLGLGTTTKAFNQGNSSGFVFMGGIGMSY